MHELSIAKAILEALEAESAKRPGARIRKVGVRLGELSGVNMDALTFNFEVLVKDSPWEPLDLEIEWCPRRQRCPTCGHAFTPQGFDLACPACGQCQTECIGGDDLDIAYLNLEESCACP